MNPIGLNLPEYCSDLGCIRSEGHEGPHRDTTGHTWPASPVDGVAGPEPVKEAPANNAAELHCWQCHEPLPALGLVVEIQFPGGPWVVTHHGRCANEVGALVARIKRTDEAEASLDRLRVEARVEAVRSGQLEARVAELNREGDRLAALVADRRRRILRLVEERLELHARIDRQATSIDDQRVEIRGQVVRIAELSEERDQLERERDVLRVEVVNLIHERDRLVLDMATPSATEQSVRRRLDEVYRWFDRKRHLAYSGLDELAEILGRRTHNPGTEDVIEADIAWACCTHCQHGNDGTIVDNHDGPCAWCNYAGPINLGPKTDISVNLAKGCTEPGCPWPADVPHSHWSGWPAGETPGEAQTTELRSVLEDVVTDYGYVCEPANARDPKGCVCSMARARRLVATWRPE